MMDFSKTGALSSFTEKVAPALELRWAGHETVLRARLREGAVWLLSHAAVLLARAGRAVFQPGILMYHRIAPNVPGLPPPSINVPPEQFRRQLAGLVARGYRFWSLRRLLEAQAAGEPVPSRVVVVTFDDGFQNVWTEAVPILRELGIPATIFLATAFLDQGGPFPFDHWGRRFYGKAPPETYRPMTWRQCEEGLSDPLVEWGAHTHTHQDFRGRPQEFQHDLERCLRLMESRLGIGHPSFAFPYGAPHLGFVDSQLMEAARQCGVRCALTTETGLVDLSTSPFGWPRIHVFSWDTPATLDAKLRDAYSWLPRRLHQWRIRRCNRSFASKLVLTIQRSTDSSTKSDQPEPGDELAIRNGGDAFHQSDGRRRPSLSPCSFPNTTTRPLISVVIPTFNRCVWLAEAVQSVLAQETSGLFDFEVVVVDNASTDETSETIARIAACSASKVRYVYEATPGDAPARNAGVRAAAGQWIAFCDDDQLAERTWLLELYRTAVRRRAAVVGGPILLLLSDDELAWCGPHLRALMRETQLYPKSQLYRHHHVPGTGNALVYGRLFEELGGFDESFREGGSDVDFFERVRRAGYALWYQPAAVMRHRVPPQRLSRPFVRWDALSGGACYARQVDRVRWGTTALPALACLRLMKAGLWHLPLAWWNQRRGRPGHALGHMSVVWRAEGYARQTLAILFPALFAQREFFESLEFRRGRALAPAGTTAAGTPDSCELAADAPRQTLQANHPR
ncbi:MAG: hypothetical protein KatS3mg110_2785 [Pirellulaceae bacterium]|nr:MAG: hypothetical protein KatS3mg110_2785 [Pirellulaceae bacterium]